MGIRIAVASLLLLGAAPAQEVPGWKDLFNGKDLSGWVNVNCAPDTWSAKDGMIYCTGKPTGVMRSEKQYENFVIHIEWMHLKPGGNSGLFAWSDAVTGPGKALPKGMEIQMLDLDWVNQNKQKDGSLPPEAYVHGELFGVGVEIVPDNPRGKRSKSVENRCKGAGEWNVYDAVCVDGTIKLSVNGKFVNGIAKAAVKKGYLCLESEGSPIQFRNIRILELPPGVTAPEQAFPPLEK